MQESQTERRLGLKIGERDQVHRSHEELLEVLDGKPPNDAQKDQLKNFRSDLADLDLEVAELSEQLVKDRAAAEQSAQIRKARTAALGVADADGENVVYRTMATYARDVLMTHGDRYARAAVENSGVGDSEVKRAAQRLEALSRTPATTLTSDLAGLNPPQHIAQIFQVIQTRRDLVEAAGTRATLNKLKIGRAHV